MPADFTLGAADIRQCCNVGYRACHTLLNKPFPLPYKTAQQTARGGNKARLYRLSDLLPRFRARPNHTSDMEAKICGLASTKQGLNQ